MASRNTPAELPIELQNGSAAFNGTVTGPLNSPQIAGHIALTNFIYSQDEGRLSDCGSRCPELFPRGPERQPDSRQSARDTSRRQLRCAIGNPIQTERSTASGSLQGAHVQDLLALAGKQDFPATGTLSASAQITGTIATPLIKADVTVTNGSLYDEPFDRLTAHIDYLNATRHHRRRQTQCRRQAAELSMRPMRTVPAISKLASSPSKQTATACRLNQFHLFGKTAVSRSPADVAVHCQGRGYHFENQRRPAHVPAHQPQRGCYGRAHADRLTEPIGALQLTASDCRDFADGASGIGVANSYDSRRTGSGAWRMIILATRK